LRYASQYIDHLLRENQRSKDSINSFQNELKNVYQQLEDAKALSEVRGKKLFGAEVDILSISEVGEKITALNEENFQAAATLGEALIHKRREPFQTDLESAVAVSKEMIGEKMTDILVTQAQKPEAEVNPLLVQVVLQVFMTKFCISKIRSWYPGDPAVGDSLSAIYSAIRSSEEQEVSGRWRALTFSNTRPNTETWKRELYQKLQSILVIASWTTRSFENEESYGTRLPSIFKAINELRTAIGENFTSADIEILAFECDKTYDPANMEEAYGDHGRQSSGNQAPETIVGTTGIGLGKNMAGRSAKDANQPEVQTIIPPKIVLTSTMNEALESARRKNKLIEKTDGPGAVGTQF